MANRPTWYSLIDRSSTNIDTSYGENALNFTGLQPGQVIPSKIHNTLWLGGGLWETYLDYGVVRTSDVLDTTIDQQWSTTKLAYTPGSNVKVGGATVQRLATYYFDGFRIELDDILLKPAGASPLLVPFVATPGAVWVYLDTSTISLSGDPLQPVATIRIESVAAGDPATPQANELALVRVDVDAAGLVSGNTYPATEPEAVLAYGALLQRWGGNTEYEAVNTYLNTSQLELVSGATFLSQNGVVFSILGSATIGTSSLNTLEVKSKPTFQADVQINAITNHAADILIGTNTLTATGGTITAPGGTVSASNGTITTLDTAVWQPDTNTLGSATAGNVQFDGNKLTLGDGTNTADVLSTVEAYAKDDSTGAGAEDIAGAGVTLVIAKEQFVRIEVTALQTVSNLGSRPLLRVRAENSGPADTILVLNGSETDPAQSFLPVSVSASEERPHSFVTYWKPETDVPAPANDTWTIQLQHGIGGAGICDSRNCEISVRFV